MKPPRLTVLMLAAALLPGAMGLMGCKPTARAIAQRAVYRKIIQDRVREDDRKRTIDRRRFGTPAQRRFDRVRHQRRGAVRTR